MSDRDPRVVKAAVKHTLFAAAGLVAVVVALTLAAGLAASSAWALDEQGGSHRVEARDTDDEMYGQADDDDDDDPETEVWERSDSSTWLGVGLESGPEGDAVRIEQVFDGSPAEAAGLKEGDEIVSIDGQATKDVAALTRAIRERKPGDRITIRVVRDGHEQSLTATLAAREKHVKVIRIPGNGDAVVDLSDAHGGLEKVFSGWGEMGLPRAWMGVATSDLTPELRRHFGAPDDRGVLVAQVRPDSPAEKAGVKVGDVLTDVAGHGVEGPSDVADAIREKDAGDTVELAVIRDGKSRSLSLTLAERPGLREKRSRMEQGGAPQMRRRAEDLRQRMDTLQKELDTLARRLEELSARLHSSLGTPAPPAAKGQGADRN